MVVGDQRGGVEERGGREEWVRGTGMGLLCVSKFKEKG